MASNLHFKRTSKSDHQHIASNLVFLGEAKKLPFDNFLRYFIIYTDTSSKNISTKNK